MKINCKKLILIVGLALFGWSNNTNAQFISTIAGNGNGGYAGDGGAATNAQLSAPFGVCVDAYGNVYIADYADQRIRKVSASTGFISTIAGNGTSGYSGDGGAATNAQLADPTGVSVDASGDVYIADRLNNSIRKVSASTGIISTIVGNGTPGYSGDGSAATSAQLHTPSGVFVDALDNVYIADEVNNSIRKVSASTGIISTIAGNGIGGYSGDGSAATSAQLGAPSGVSVDDSGNVYIADAYNNRIRKVSIITGIISTLAGDGTIGFSGDGTAAFYAQLYDPIGVSVDASGNVYIADTFNNRVRKIIAPTGIINTWAGSTYGYSGDGGAATNAQLAYPFGVFVDIYGDVYIADRDNHVIRKVTPGATAITPQPIGNIQGLRLYPNPAITDINITGITGKTSIKMYDVFGKLVLQKEVENNTTLNTSQLAQGIYTLVTESNGSRTVNKAVINK